LYTRAAIPANYACFLIGTQRTVKANRALGFALAFVAGSINAGGFLAVYWNRHAHHPARVLADRDSMVVLAGLLSAFLVGGIMGAFGFKHLGYVASVPVAVLLALLAIVPAVDDLRRGRSAG